MEQLELIGNKASKRNESAVLMKLLERDAKDITELVQLTGWDRDLIQNTLLRMIAGGRVKCVDRTGLIMYEPFDNGNKYLRAFEDMKHSQIISRDWQFAGY